MVDKSSDDPFGPPDGTILRPRPGAGRRAGPAPASPPGYAPPPPPSRAPGTGSFAAGPPVSAAITDFLGTSRNPILQAAAPLLTLAARLQSTVQQANVATLRTQVVHEIRAFDDRLRSSGVAPEDAVVARYALCTFIDAAILNTPWGSQSDWAAQSLLVMFHKEVSGGEKLFQILDKVVGDPRRYIDLIELLYVCLALGYEGKYRLEPGGQARLVDIQHQLYRLIRDQRQIRDTPLSPHWQGVQDRRHRLIRYVPWWVVAAAACSILAVAFIVYQAKLRSLAAPVKAALASPVAPIDYPAVATPRASRLKELLAGQEQAGKLTVEELGGKTVVTVTSSDLFRSGSARLNPDHYPTLRTIALALNQVTGRVLIVGHTDDQPLRSFQFADNFELSRERAVAVANILKPAIDDFGRIEWSGAGATQPRYQPIGTAENRARNRRVEIIHIPGGEGGR